MGNVHMEAAQINYRGGEKKMSVEEALKNTSGEAAAIAQLQSDVANLSDVKANQITIAPTFSAETAYDPGDLVYYNGLSYRCVNAHEGEWDADDFAATTISNELASLMSGLTNLIHLYDSGEVTTNEYGVLETTVPKTYTVMCARFGDKFVNMFTSPQRQNWAAFVFDLDSSGNCVKSAGATGYLAVHYIAQTAVLDS